MRIGLVYADGAFAGLVKDARIDREARKGKVSSDHAPVIVDLNAQPVYARVAGAVTAALSHIVGP